MSADRQARRRAVEMRKLPESLREELIAADDNVVGYERFIARHKQVALRGAYRKPSTPKGAA